MVLDAIAFQPQWWVSVPSFAACYSALHFSFDRYVWRLPLLRKLQLNHPPVLGGKWDGEVESSYSQGDRTRAVKVVIVQRWSKMVLRLETEQSLSHSTTASLRSVDLPYPKLSYQYLNEPRPNAPDTMAMHRGTANLELIGHTLEGEYYTDRGRGEVGTIKLWKSSERD